MTNNQLLKFFQLQRQIFGICPDTGNIFRLSDCHIFVKKKPDPDWLQKIEIEQLRLAGICEKLDERKFFVAEQAKIIGRREADNAVKKFDKVFKPKKLNADDSKVIFHPIDYIVFNGMKSGLMKNIILMDRVKTTSSEKQIQKSIAKVIERQNYEWITLRVEDNGNIIEE
jgi:predicted Holliday junction resolvase-like endonuclease